MGRRTEREREHSVGGLELDINSVVESLHVHGVRSLDLEQLERR